MGSNPIVRTSKIKYLRGMDPVYFCHPVLQYVPMLFQWVTSDTSASTRHDCDMRCTTVGDYARAGKMGFLGSQVGCIGSASCPDQQGRVSAVWARLAGLRF